MKKEKYLNFMEKYNSLKNNEIFNYYEQYLNKINTTSTILIPGLKYTFIQRHKSIDSSVWTLT